MFPDYFIEAPALFRRGDWFYLLYGHCESAERASGETFCDSRIHNDDSGCCFCYQGSGILVYRAKDPMGPWLPQTAAQTLDRVGHVSAKDTAAHDLACRPANDDLHLDGYALLGQGSCRDASKSIL